MPRTSTTPVTTRRPPRTRLVWAALAASMVLAGGGLHLLNNAPAHRSSGGVALTPLVSLAGAGSLESVFRTRAPLGSSRWDAIVIHDSGSAAGSPASIAEDQRRVSQVAGLGYHFVVGNGAGMGNGEIHVGYRWLDQLPGAHVAGTAGAEYNARSIGICLVGDGDRRPFTAEQLRRTTELANALADRLGISRDRVFLHSDLAAVSSPGRLFPQTQFRERLAAVAP